MATDSQFEELCSAVEKAKEKRKKVRNSGFI